MINQNPEEPSASPPGADKNVDNEQERGFRTTRNLTARTFDFLWKRDSRREASRVTARKEENQWKREDLIGVKIVERKLKNANGGATSFDFFRNIRKRMQIRGLTACRSTRKAKEIEASCTQNPTNPPSHSIDPPAVSIRENISAESRQVLYDALETATGTMSEALSNGRVQRRTDETRSDNYFQMESGIESDDETDVSRTHENVPIVFQDTLAQFNRVEQLNEVLRDDFARDISEAIINEHRVKASLTEELLKLSKYGWYWGPISGDEADSKLRSEPDGAFLIRDSSDDRYVLTLSFKSSGKLLHARMEHSGGLFSLCNQSESEGFASVPALINHSINFSQSGVFCYSRPKYPGYPSFPVRLTKPVSRFTQVRSLQYLCRFVIRQNTRLDNIHKLPLPKTIKGYIEEAHYY